MYDVFDLSLTDEYIFNLDMESIRTLIAEAILYQDQAERELIDLILGGEAPSWGVSASKMSMDPLLFQDEIDNDPSFLGKLKEAEEIAAKSGRAEAIEYTALLHQKGLEAIYGR